MSRTDFVDFSHFFSGRGKEIYSSCEDTIRKLDMHERISSGVLIGLSGGADSVMLLGVLLEYRKRRGLDFDIVCSHVNHGIRGTEADCDEDFCRAICKSLGVELVVSKICVPKLAEQCGLGIEETARNARYSCFDEIIRGRNGVCAIAVAHNMSDNAETVVFNMLRGSGARGGAGIPPVRDNIVRPLIGVSKSDITLALDDANIPYVIDATNASNDYSRNYIRNEVIPRLDKLTSDPEKMIFRFSSNLRSDDDYIRSVAEQILNDNSVITNVVLKDLHYSVFARVVSLMAGKMDGGVSFKIISDIHELLEKENFSYSLIGDCAFVCERGKCFVRKNIAEIPDYKFDIRLGTNHLSPFLADCVYSKEKINNYFSNVYKFSIQANLSSAIIEGGLYIRSKMDGDTIYYGGMTHKLKKLFSDRKVPASKRKQIPILCDDKGVVWVPGCGVRDDNPPDELREDNFVLLGMLSNDDGDALELYSVNQFKT